MKTSQSWSIFACLGALILAVASPAAAAPQETAAEVASVNGETITRADLDREMMQVRQKLIQMGKPLDESRLSEVRQQVLERLINRELLYQQSLKSGIDVDQAMVDREFESLKGKFPSEEAFKTALNKSGLSESALRRQMRKRLTIREFVSREFVQKLPVSEEEMKDYYDSNPDQFSRPEQVHARHILIRVEPKAGPEEKAAAREKIEDIQAKLKAGEDFEALAREHSDCPSGAKGGDLGFFGRKRMVKSFEDTAFSLKPGETSDVIETPFGFHIVRAIEKRPAGTVGFEEAKAQLQKYLKEKKVSQGLSEYIEGLRDKAAVERFLSADPS